MVPVDPTHLIAVFIVAALYSSVGHGGASGYLAVLSLMSMSKPAASSTALVLNVVVASMSAISYWRAKHLRVRTTITYLIPSVPAAFLGGVLHVPSYMYETLLAICLIVAAVRLAMPLKTGSADIYKQPSWRMIGFVGGVIGLISGIVGIGGGIFLSPVIVLAKWDNTKNASGTAALFIVVNSLAGLFGRYLTNTLQLGGEFAPLMCCAAIGGLIGSHLGAQMCSQTTLKRILSLVLGIASVKLLFA